MASSEYLHDLDPVIQQTIRAKGRRLTGRARLRDEDVEDVARDCHVELLRKLPAFDPSRASPVAFAVKVLGNFLLNALRNRRAARRDPNRITSLGGPAGAAAVEENRLHRRQVRSHYDEVDLRHDLEVALQALAPELRELAERLRSQSIAEAARGTGVPRTTLHSRVANIRGVFERHHLADYLGRPSSLRGLTG